LEIDQVIERQETWLDEQITPAMITLTDENKELHELALKGLKYALRMCLSDDSSKSNLFRKIKAIKK